MHHVLHTRSLAVPVRTRPQHPISQLRHILLTTILLLHGTQITTVCTVSYYKACLAVKPFASNYPNIYAHHTNFLHNAPAPPHSPLPTPHSPLSTPQLPTPQTYPWITSSNSRKTPGAAQTIDSHVIQNSPPSTVLNSAPASFAINDAAA